MIPVLSRAQMRDFDKFAVESCNVPGVVLMENAGRGAADVLSAMIAERQARTDTSPGQRRFPTRHVAAPGQPARYPLHAKVVVVCGAGNNGGDGYVVARHLMARGADVEVFLAASSEKVTGDARINHDAYIDLGGRLTQLPRGAEGPDFETALEEADFIVDAIFGTGLDRPIRGHLLDMISAINASKARVVALDVPSGLDADSGSPLGASVHADDTVTFAHLKIGLLTPEGARLAGNVHVVDLGVPDGLILAHVGHMAEVIRPENVGAMLTPREANVHKHVAGNVLIVAGSSGKVGAALLTAHAALRAGAGLATVCTWPDAKAALESRVVEVMTAGIDPADVVGSLDTALVGKSAVAIGPGLGLGEDARAVVDHVVLSWNGIKIVDADAITHFTGRAEALADAQGHVVLTPHPGELGRLLGRSSRAIESDRFGAVRDAVELTRAVVVLKGARTVIAMPDGRLFVCMAGNPALATAGSGDVLTGILSALACHLPEDQAACAGVLLHALAGDRYRADSGCDRGLLAGEIADLIPGVVSRLTQHRAGVGTD